MEKLVELCEQEVQIDFQLNCKCRANVRLMSLNPTTPIAFKVQTSSPTKFLVNPPNGVIPPLSYATFQVILKPQLQLPPSFPRSPTDRFLIKTAEFRNSTHESINSWFTTETQLVTHDLKLKVAYVGSYLLRHAINISDLDAAKSIVKRQKCVVTELSRDDFDSLIQLAIESKNSEKLVSLFCEARQKIEVGENKEIVEEESRRWRELGVAAVQSNRMDESLRYVKEMSEEGESLDSGDKYSRTALHVGVSNRNVGFDKLLLKATGANKNADDQETFTTALENLDRRIANLNMEMKADVNLSDNTSSCLAVDFPRDNGHTDAVNMQERGESVLTTARRGEIENLKKLLKGGANANHKDQYGLTPLHAAAIKGHKVAVSMLIEYGMDLECTDKEGHTALHMAVEGGDIDTVELLVNKGANVNAVSKKGATPIYLAKAMGYDNIYEFLLTKGVLTSSTLSSML